MTTSRWAFADLIRTFLETEAADVDLGCADMPARIAAIGTIASVLLASDTLREPLAEAGVRPEDVVTLEIDSPASLAVRHDWQLALILSPYKQLGFAYCDSAGTRALRAEVVDTIVRTPKGLVGINANSFAIGATAQQLCGDQEPERVLVVGTGATARSAIVGLDAVFPSATFGVIGRSSIRASQLSEEVGIASAIVDIAAFRPTLLIHATTVGERDDHDTLGVDVACVLRPGLRVLDLNQRVTVLQRAALSGGCATMGGRLVQLVTNLLRVSVLRPSAVIRRPGDVRVGDRVRWTRGAAYAKP